MFPCKNSDFPSLFETETKRNGKQTNKMLKLRPGPTLATEKEEGGEIAVRKPISMTGGFPFSSPKTVRSTPTSVPGAPVKKKQATGAPRPTTPLGGQQGQVISAKPTFNLQMPAINIKFDLNPKRGPTTLPSKERKTPPVLPSTAALLEVIGEQEVEREDDSEVAPKRQKMEPEFEPIVDGIGPQREARAKIFALQDRADDVRVKLEGLAIRVQEASMRSALAESELRIANSPEFQQRIQHVKELLSTSQPVAPVSEC